MNRLLTPLPVWLILADMAYTFAVGILQSFNLIQTRLPKGGLPVSPDIAFSGFQVAVNGGMAVIIGFGLWTLLKLNRSVMQRQILPIGVFRTLGLVAVLAFSIPSLWQWAWALIKLAGGSETVASDSPRYLVIAVCQPLVACLCLYRLTGWYRLHKHAVPEALHE
ncbi:hypothetical protein [Neisseria sp.]|uniref:hypothetical protein n=1 Tax=Neisseria sp. TaxID=192066 RepID=UPI0026DB46BD|nr:hypothetical protein [Neisseria sp.]MDO4906853.1 hypothetical protein [Neisseria sp.]